jgi:hypothetical protein
MEEENDVEKCGRADIDFPDKFEIRPHPRTEKPERGSRGQEEPELASAATRSYEIARERSEYETNEKRLAEISKDGEVLRGRTERCNKGIDDHQNGGSGYQKTPIVTSIQQKSPFPAAHSDWEDSSELRHSPNMNLGILAEFQ